MTAGWSCVPFTGTVRIQSPFNRLLRIVTVKCRYAAKSDWETTHRDAKAYQALGAWSKSSGIDMVKTGQSYYEADIGYM